MAQYDFMKDIHPDKFVEFFLCEALSDKAREIIKPGQDGLDVVLTINGVECDFLQVIKHIESQLDTLIAKEALKHAIEPLQEVERLAGDLYVKFQDLTSEVESCEGLIRRHLGID